MNELSENDKKDIEKYVKQDTYILKYGTLWSTLMFIILKSANILSISWIFILTMPLIPVLYIFTVPIFMYVIGAIGMQFYEQKDKEQKP